MNKSAKYDLPVLNLGEDPFERGLIHGRELSSMINNNVKIITGEPEKLKE